jgi:hypothetical protein
MESLRNYIVIALVALLGVAGNASAQTTSMAARSLSLASPPNTTVPFANLTNPALVPQTNGTLTYCSDCRQTTVCAAGGSGALAQLVNNAWQCGLGTSTTGTASINPGTTGQPGGYLANGTIISPMTSIQGISVNGVINAQAYGAKGDAVTDNTAAFNAAMTAVGSQGTIYIPAGTYKWNTAGPFNFTKANCGVSIVGDSTGATILEPNFSNGDAISYIDNTIEYPPFCWARVEHIRFNSPTVTPANLKLLHVSNIMGITADDIYATNFYGANDSVIDLDNGPGTTAGTTWTELNFFHHIRGLYNTHFLVFDGHGVINSLNNNILADAHCNPWNTGDCVFLTGFIDGSEGETGASRISMNVDLNNGGTDGGQAVVRTTHKAGDFGNITELNIIAQNTGSTAPNYCFDAPAGSGSWNFIGRVQCAMGAITYERNNNPVLNLISTGTESLIFNTTTSILSAATFTGSATPSLGGGGVLAPGSNSVAGQISGVAATGNGLTPGFTCPHDVVGGFLDPVTGAPVAITGRSKTAIIFSATAGHEVDYFGMGCD